MDMTSKNAAAHESVGLNRYFEVRNWKRAKKTGLLCIGCAIAAGLLSVGASFLKIFAAPLLMLYFLFLLLCATLGLFGFQEVFCNRNKKLNLSISMIALVILMVLFILAFSITLSSNSEMASILTKFWILYGLLSSVIPILLTISALISNNAEKWKSLMPLAIPALLILSSIMANSKNSSMTLLLLPIGWGLLGSIIYLGNVTSNSSAD